MKKCLLLFLLLTAGMMISCGRQIIPHTDFIQREFRSIQKSVASNRMNMRNLKDTTVGKSGFFYVVDNTGKVSFHPQAVLIGRDFSSFKFMQELLEKKKGCIIYGIGPRERVIFFAPINDREVLCLSIESEEVRGSMEECIISGMKVHGED
jgi:hypothetical protein